VARNFAITH
jgi:hypothetical protein